MQMTKRDTVHCAKLDCEKYVCLHNMIQQRNKMLLFPGAVGRQMVGTPAGSCTLPAETQCPQPLGKGMLLHFSNTPVCWATEQNHTITAGLKPLTLHPQKQKGVTSGDENEMSELRFTLLPFRHIVPMAMIYWTEINTVCSSGVCLVVLRRIYYIFTVVT